MDSDSDTQETIKIQRQDPFANIKQKQSKQNQLLKQKRASLNLKYKNQKKAPFVNKVAKKAAPISVVKNGFKLVALDKVDKVKISSAALEFKNHLATAARIPRINALKQMISRRS